MGDVMSDEQRTGMESDGAARIRPFTDDEDVEGHIARAGRATEQRDEGMGAEAEVKIRPFIEDDNDSEGHTVRDEGGVFSDEPDPDSLARSGRVYDDADTGGHAYRPERIADETLQPDRALHGRPVTADSDTEGHAYKSGRVTEQLDEDMGADELGSRKF